MNYSERQQIINPRTGKIERVFVNLEAVYPNPDDPNEEMSFEELRAKARGWLHKDWPAEMKPKKQNEPHQQVDLSKSIEYKELNDRQHGPGHEVPEIGSKNIAEENHGLKNERPKKMKIREVRAEAQTGIGSNILFLILMLKLF